MLVQTITTVKAMLRGSLHKSCIEQCKRKRSKTKVHVIVVYNFDRFSRSGANAIYIANELKKQNVAVESVTQPTDAFTPGGELQQNIYFSFSQYDNSTRRQRMIDGVREALEAGKWHAEKQQNNLGFDLGNLIGLRHQRNGRKKQPHGNTGPHVTTDWPRTVLPTISAGMRCQINTDQAAQTHTQTLGGHC